GNAGRHALSRNLLPGRQLGPCWSDLRARSHGPGTPKARSSHQRHLCLSAGPRCSAAFMRRSHAAGSMAMKALITNELCSYFIECRYRGYLKTMGASEPKSHLLEVSARLSEGYHSRAREHLLRAYRD